MKEESKDGKPPTEENKKEDKPHKDADFKAKGKSGKKELREEKPDKSPKLQEAEKVVWKSFENCGRVCKEREDCFQYVFYTRHANLGCLFDLGSMLLLVRTGRLCTSRAGWWIGFGSGRKIMLVKGRHGLILSEG